MAHVEAKLNAVFWRKVCKNFLRVTKAVLDTRRLCFELVFGSCLNGPSVSAPTPDLICSQPLLRAPAPVPTWGVCLQEQPLHPRAVEV